MIYHIHIIYLTNDIETINQILNIFKYIQISLRQRKELLVLEFSLYLYI